MATGSDPFADLLALQRDMDRIMTRFGAQPRQPGDDGHPFWMPAVDVLRQGSDTVVRVELPGVSPGDINVSVTGNMLTIKGERRREQGREEGDYVMRESTYGAFERRITMPEDIDAAQVRAQYRAGVLDVTVPASALMTPRPQPVQVTGAPAPPVASSQQRQTYGQPQPQQPQVAVQGGWVVPQQPTTAAPAQPPQQVQPSEQQMGTSYATEPAHQSAEQQPQEESRHRSRLGGWLHGDER